MTEPTKPNGGLLNRTLTMAASNLADKGVPEAKHGAKLKGAYLWWPVAGLCALATLGVVGLTVKSASEGHEPSLTLLAIEAGVPLLFALFAAFKADAEGTGAILSAIVSLGKSAKDAAK